MTKQIDPAPESQKVPRYRYDYGRIQIWITETVRYVPESNGTVPNS
jgi:hypothetical protein